MRAVLFRASEGRMSVESDVPVPRPSGNQVLIRVRLAEVCPSNGDFLSTNNNNESFIPGIDAVGTVEAIGWEVKGFQVGDRVFAWTPATYAEFALVPQNRAFRIPDNVSFDVAGAVGIAYFTAYHSLVHKACVKADQTVLVHGAGASGAIGLACVQIAKLLGIKIIATASTSDGIGLIGHYGCTLPACNHTESHCDGDRSTYDVVVETEANVNLAEDLEHVSRGGTVVLVGNLGAASVFDFGKVIAKGCAVVGMNLASMTDEQIEQTGAFLVAALRDGHVKPMISHEFPLVKVETAHEQVASSGKLLGSMVLAL